MPYCAFCGTQVAPNTPICPTAATAQRGPPAGGGGQGPSGLPLLVILIVVGFFLLAVVVGIIGAILIPNYLDVLQVAKQKRTVAESNTSRYPVSRCPPR